jgi:hypothetical protein
MALGIMMIRMTTMTVWMIHGKVANGLDPLDDGSITINCPTCDIGGDGINNLQEYLSD